MKTKFHYCQAGSLWHGFHVSFTKNGKFIDFGLGAFCVYKALRFSELYLWRFSIQFFHKERK